jgi:hypothetical protein
MDLLDRLMRTAPVQERFGPSLPALLAPRIDRLPAIARRVGAVLALLVGVVIVALVLRTRDPSYSGSVGSAHFSVSWPRSMTREATPGGDLLLLRQSAGSGLVASFEVAPLRLPAYSGEISGLLPVLAINYERRLEQRYGARFTPWSLGRTRIINTAAFTFTYKLYVASDPAPYFGRVVFITAHLHGDRSGLILSLLQDPATLKQATEPAKPTPDAVGAGGPVQEPLQHLRIS